LGVVGSDDAGNLSMNCGIIFINHHFVFCCSSNKYKNILDSMGWKVLFFEMRKPRGRARFIGVNKNFMV
jgi:hypothetical protein